MKEIIDWVSHSSHLSNFILLMFKYRHSGKGSAWPVRTVYRYQMFGPERQRTCMETALGHLQSLSECCFCNWVSKR